MLDLSKFRRLECIRLADPQVSARSLWNEPIWYLDGRLPGYASMTIGWDFDAPDGLIDVFKLVAVSLFMSADSPYHHRTAHGFRVSAKVLAAFMLANDYDTLAELDQNAFERYCSSVSRIISKPSRNAQAFIDAMDAFERDAEARKAKGSDDDGVDEDVEGEDAEHAASSSGAEAYAEPHGAVAEEEGKDPLTISIATSHLQIWRYLQYASETLASFGIEGAFDPFADTPLSTVAEGIAKKGLDDVEPLPDQVAIPILNAAMRLLGKPADDVIRLQSEFLGIRGGDLGSVSKLNALRALVTGFEFSEVAEGEGPWHPPITLKTDLSKGAMEVRRLVRRIHMAALVMLLAGTGMRISEICSLEVEDREIDEALPSCISTEPSLSGHAEHFLLTGLLSKNQPVPKPEVWLLGSRPRLAHAEPATARAVRVLEELLQPWRRLADVPELARQLQVSSYSSGLPAKAVAIRPIRAITLRHLLRDFYADIGLKALLSEAARNDERLRAYVVTDGRCIHHHQWRHTYYEFMVRLDERLLPAVSLHFKHNTIAATERGYGTKDASVREARDGVRVRETVRSFTRRRFGEVEPVGNMARELERERAALEQMVGDVPGAAAEKRVERFVIDQDIRIWPAEHGDCLMPLNPDKAVCRKVGRTVDFRAGAPDFAMRTPALCCGCANFSVGRDHAPFWRRRYIDNRTAWIESDRNPLFRIALRNAVQAAAMLRALGEDVPVILRKPIDPRPPIGDKPRPTRGHPGAT